MLCPYEIHYAIPEVGAVEIAIARRSGNIKIFVSVEITRQIRQRKRAAEAHVFKHGALCRERERRDVYSRRSREGRVHVESHVFELDVFDRCPVDVAEKREHQKVSAVVIAVVFEVRIAHESVSAARIIEREILYRITVSVERAAVVAEAGKLLAAEIYVIHQIYVAVAACPELTRRAHEFVVAL